jgi:hypothetical protein
LFSFNDTAVAVDCGITPFEEQPISEPEAVSKAVKDNKSLVSFVIEAKETVAV